MVLIGRITKDATVKKLKDDREVVNFSLAINDYYKPKGAAEGVSLTTFYNCSYWISPKIALWLTKGSLVELSGRIYINAYIGLDGEAKASLNCHVNSITVHQHIKGKEANTTAKEEVSDDLPF
ncbi:MAG: single-stranded DNA-binding protein [Chitinophagaceae bacterium]|nr:single-stranded DNA-binding protein [Chitinophagaceae bacterium]